MFYLKHLFNYLLKDTPLLLVIFGIEIIQPIPSQVLLFAV